MTQSYYRAGNKISEISEITGGRNVGGPRYSLQKLPDLDVTDVLAVVRGLSHPLKLPMIKLIM
jgi:hypothetical protein